MNRVNDMIRFCVLLDGIGNTMMAGFYATHAFELLLRQGCGLSADDDEKKLWEMINDLCKRSAFYRPHKTRLDRVRDKRNDFIHGKKTDAEHIRKIIDDLCTVQGLDTESITVALDHEDYERLYKKFCAPGQNKSAVEDTPGQIKFQRKHFLDLYRMGEKMQQLVASLGAFCKELHPNLAFDDVSRVDPKTAYVWAAAVLHEKNLRSKVDKPSLSILATNRDIRVYLDFGGRCFAGRRNYLNRLIQGGFDEELEKLDQDTYLLFDIFWYFNLERRFTVREFLTMSPDKREQEKFRIKCFLDELTKTEKSPSNQSRNVKQLRTRLFNTISRNILLLGRVFPYDEVVGFKDFSEAAADTMRDLFPVFQKISV